MLKNTTLIRSLVEKCLRFLSYHEILESSENTLGLNPKLQEAKQFAAAIVLLVYRNASRSGGIAQVDINTYKKLCDDFTVSEVKSAAYEVLEQLVKLEAGSDRMDSLINLLCATFDLQDEKDFCEKFERARVEFQSGKLPPAARRKYVSENFKDVTEGTSISWIASVRQLAEDVIYDAVIVAISFDYKLEEQRTLFERLFIEGESEG